MTKTASPQRRANHLLRWYPPTWRERYGDEFLELLIADLSERPRWSWRTFNVVGSGIQARLCRAGLAGGATGGSDQTRASLAALTYSLAAFLALGIAMWSQLTIGWQWSPPDTPGTAIAVVAMSIGVCMFALLALTAVVPVIWTVTRTMARKEAARLGRPLSLLVLGALVLVVGSRHFGNGWPGTGGHPWSDQGLVPGGIAAFSWASTLSITSYWAHPAALLSFPPAEIAWMIMSPIAMVMVAIGSAKIVRRVPLSETALRFEMSLGVAAAASMATFLSAAALWMLEGGAGPKGLFRTGAIDRFTLIAMAGALLVAVQSLRRVRSSGLALRSP
jgi:hypothetical protein